MTMLWCKAGSKNCPLFPGGIQTEKRTKHTHSHISIASERCPWIRGSQDQLLPRAEGEHGGYSGQPLPTFTAILGLAVLTQVLRLVRSAFFRRLATWKQVPPPCNFSEKSWKPALVPKEQELHLHSPKHKVVFKAASPVWSNACALHFSEWAALV